MKNTLLIFILTFILGCQHRSENKKQAFFDNMSNLCGQTYTGYSTYPDDPEHDFAGQLLRAEFITCNNEQIRIKFDVGADRSRTWVITNTEQGLLLKHDHRHEDGTPDEITNYGGWANNQGTAWAQYFAADDETAALIPAAKTNVWLLKYEPATEVLTYDLKRHNQPRYQAQLRPLQ